MNSTEELDAIFKNDENMDVLMETGFTSSISVEKKKQPLQGTTVDMQCPKMFLLSF